MKKKFLISLITMVTLLGLAGCATDLSSNSYEEGVVGETQTVDYGVIIDTQPVKILANKGVGSLLGAGAGAVGGSAIGGGRGSVLGAMGGALVGGIAGDAADKAINSQIGIRYVIRLEQDRHVNETNIVSHAGKTSISHAKQVAKIISIVQGLKKGDIRLSRGARVMVLNNGTDRARVIPVD